MSLVSVLLVPIAQLVLTLRWRNLRLVLNACLARIPPKLVRPPVRCALRGHILEIPVPDSVSAVLMVRPHQTQVLPLSELALTHCVHQEHTTIPTQPVPLALRDLTARFLESIVAPLAKQVLTQKIRVQQFAQNAPQVRNLNQVRQFVSL